MFLPNYKQFYSECKVRGTSEQVEISVNTLTSNIIIIDQCFTHYIFFINYCFLSHFPLANIVIL